MNFTKTLTVAALAIAYGGLAHAAVTAEEAKKLGTTLTSVGAEKAGNDEKKIPEYTGGLTTPHPPYTMSGYGSTPNPYPVEKPLLSIDAKNRAQHEANLTDGAKALMKAYPSFRIDVYKTQRTAAFPRYVVDNTIANATRAKT